MWRCGSLTDASPREIRAAKRGTVARRARKLPHRPPLTEGRRSGAAAYVRPLSRPHAVPAAAASVAPGPEKIAGEG
jgi:hypothetical protein